MCRLRRRRDSRCARSARAAPASTLARVTVWRGAAHVPPQAAAAWPLLLSHSAGSAGSYAGARHGVARRRHMCRLKRRRLGRCCARSERAAPVLGLARVTVWRGAARVPPQVAVAWPSLRSLSAGCAGFYAGARHGVARGGPFAASGGGGFGRCCAHSTRAAPSSTLARVTLWREAACVLPQAAAAWPSLRLLDAGSAGSSAGARLGVARGGICAASGGGGSAVAALARSRLRQLLAGARHGVARGSTCAASGGGGLAVAALARRGLRRLLRWRESRCSARRHVCCHKRRRLGCRRARSAQAAPASTLARVTMWRGAAHVPPQAAAA